MSVPHFNISKSNHSKAIYAPSCVRNVYHPAFYSFTLSVLASNWILRKVKPNRWIPFIVIAWGTVTTLSGLIQNFGGLTAIRLMLGLCEGGILPGIVSNPLELY